MDCAWQALGCCCVLPLSHPAGKQEPRDKVLHKILRETQALGLTSQDAWFRDAFFFYTNFVILL